MEDLQKRLFERKFSLTGKGRKPLYLRTGTPVAAICVAVFVKKDVKSQ